MQVSHPHLRQPQLSAADRRGHPEGVVPGRRRCAGTSRCTIGARACWPGGSAGTWLPFGGTVETSPVTARAIDGQAGRALQEYDEAITLARQAGAELPGGSRDSRAAGAAGAQRTSRARPGRVPRRDRLLRAAGDWTHPRITLRNLAGLLRRLGDDETATLITACCDRAPDPPSRTGALDEASRAIDRHLPAFPRPAQPRTR